MVDTRYPHSLVRDAGFEISLTTKPKINKNYKINGIAKTTKGTKKRQKEQPINALDKSLLGAYFMFPMQKVFTPNIEKSKSQCWPPFTGSNWTIVGNEYWTKVRCYWELDENCEN